MIFASHKKTSPAAVRRRDAVIGDFLNRRAVAGEGLAEGPRGTGLSGGGGSLQGLFQRWDIVAYPTGFEPAASRVGVLRSIQLGYG